MFLVLSNVAIVPAILYAHIRHLIPEMALLTAVLAASTAFHMCQVEWFCFGVELRELQIVDHFMVYTALVWFSLYFAGVAERPRTGITIGVAPVMLVAIVHFIGTLMDGAIIVALVLVLTVLALTYAFYARGGPPVAWGALVVSMGLLAAGVFLHVFGGDFGPSNVKYPVAHSIWHILSMLALYYVIGIPYRDENGLRQAYFGEQKTGKRAVHDAETVTVALAPVGEQQNSSVAVGSPSRGKRSTRAGRQFSLGISPDRISII